MNRLVAMAAALVQQDQENKPKLSLVINTPPRIARIVKLEVPPRTTQRKVALCAIQFPHWSLA